MFRKGREAVMEGGWRIGRLSEQMASARDQQQLDPLGSSGSCLAPRAGLSWRQRKPTFHWPWAMKRGSQLWSKVFWHL